MRENGVRSTLLTYLYLESLHYRNCAHNFGHLFIIWDKKVKSVDLTLLTGSEFLYNLNILEEV